jgi:hypothetical protein
MKLLFLFLIGLPFFGKAQCENFIGGDTTVATSIIETSKKYLQFPMVSYSKPGFVLLRDKAEFCTIRINYEMKNTLVGAELVKMPGGITSVYIGGPWERVKKLYDEYFLPKIKCAIEESPTVSVWNNQKLVHIEYGTHSGIAIGFIKIEPQKVTSK